MTEQMEHTAAEPVQETSFPGLLQMAWRRKSYIALGIVIGLVLGAIYYVMARPRYESTAQILVLKKRPDTPISGPTPGVPQAEDYLATHQIVIRSPFVINKAIDKGNLRNLECFRGETNLTNAITEALSVGRERDRKASPNVASQILNLSFRGGVAEECAHVLESVLDAYQDFLTESSSNVTKETLELITRARDVLQKDLEKKEEDYRKFREETPLLWKNEEGLTLYQTRLSMIETKRLRLQMRRGEINATIKAVEKAQAQGNRSEAMQVLAGLEAKDLVGTPSVTPTEERRGLSGGYRRTLDEELVRLQLQQAQLLENYGEDHPHVLAVRERIDVVRSMLSPSATEFSKLREPVAKEQEQQVALKTGQLKQEITDLERGERSLAQFFEEQQKEAKKAYPYETQDEAYRKSIDRSQVLYDTTLKRLSEIDIVKDFGGFDSQVITPPETGEKVAPRAALVGAVALFLGVVLGCGLAYLAEFSDQSFHNPEQIRRQLALPVIGHIPVFSLDGEGEKVAINGTLWDPALCTCYAPRSREAEAYRGVRTALYFSTRGKRSRVIQITSPDMGEGKTTLAVNLAASMAQSGKRVLLLDADFRRPRLDKIFGLANSAGLASVLAGDSEPDEVIQSTPVPGLSVIPCGPRPPNPAELLTSPRLKELLDFLREQYDFVIVDTPPLLAVTDPAVVASSAEAVLLVLRLSKNTRSHARRAKEILDTLGANLTGIVVNGLPPGAGTYGYDYGYYPYGDGDGDSVGNFDSDGRATFKEVPVN